MPSLAVGVADRLAVIAPLAPQIAVFGVGKGAAAIFAVALESRSGRGTFRVWFCRGPEPRHSQNHCDRTKDDPSSDLLPVHRRLLSSPDLPSLPKPHDFDATTIGPRGEVPRS